MKAPDYERDGVRLRCRLGWHRWIFWYAPTGHLVDPLYEPRVECLYCLRRRP